VGTGQDERRLNLGDMDLRRAGCVGTRTSGSEVRVGETDRQ
jgi:hypothetical protein